MASPPPTSPGPGVARHPRRACAPHPGPYPPDLSRCHLLRGVTTLVPHVHLPVSLAGPGPSGSAGPSRRCQGCSHPPRRLPVQAALSFTGLLRQASDGGLSPPSGKHSASWRTKSQIQALDRTAAAAADATRTPEKAHPRLRTARHHHPVRRARGRHRQGARRLPTTGTGTRTSCASSSRSPRPTRGKELHVVLDNYATHKHPRSRPGWRRTRGSTLHFTPTSGSWLNLVEVFFAIITRQAIRRGTFTSVRRPHRRDPRPTSTAGTTTATLHLDQDRRRDPPARHRRSKNLRNHAQLVSRERGSFTVGYRGVCRRLLLCHCLPRTVPS